MSATHPIIAVTGSSGAGTTSVMRTFEQIFRRERRDSRIHRRRQLSSLRPRDDEARKWRRPSPAASIRFSHFGPDSNLFEELEGLFRSYGETGRGKHRKYLHDEQEAARYGAEPGTFTEWQELPEDTDVLFYEGLHGAVACGDVDVARHVDLLIGVVPVINLEWIQKLHRDKSTRGYSAEAVTDTILRRMHDYVHYICPQFSRTHINFQRVPVVDTSNPFIARFIPTQDESFLVIRFGARKGSIFPICCRCSTARSCPGPTRSCVPAERWTSPCS